MYYSTNEIATLLHYKTPQSFLQAYRSKKVDLLNKIAEHSIPAKVGKKILWNKEKIDKILNEKN